MELQDKPLDPQESLKLIQQFIAGTRNNIRKSAFGFIFWGILIAVAALIVSVFISPVNQLLLVGGSFLLGYLLPGILLVRKRNEEC